MSGIAPAASLGGYSNVNLDRPGQTRSNFAIVPVGADGSISLYAISSGHLVVDVLGYFAATPQPTAAGRFVELAQPERVLDTRTETGGPLAAQQPRRVPWPAVDQAAEGDDFGDEDAASDDFSDDVSAPESSSEHSTAPLSFDPPSFEPPVPAPAPDEPAPSHHEEPVQVVSSPVEHVPAAPEPSPVSPVESVERSDRLPPEQS